MQDSLTSNEKEASKLRQAGNQADKGKQQAEASRMADRQRTNNEQNK